METPVCEPDALTDLVKALRALPGVGVRTARRMAYHLLQHDPQAARALSQALVAALDTVMHCERCNGFSQTPLCRVCADEGRDAGLLCVVETPADQNTIEATQNYRGFYYILMGRLAPLEGVGAQELNIRRLFDRALDGQVQEVILATNFTAEGETTAHYLGESLRARGLKVSRIARGVPAGSELEYVDAGTVAWAMMERKAT